MCGIAGILYHDSAQRVTERELQRMVDQLHHRGPDGSGLYVKNHIGLGHARLSIIDIEGGTQPIHNEDSAVWVSFNGEIFNYIELRQELEAKGHQFYTHTDTEVIVHLYEEYGEAFVNHLNGQFSIALWDEQQQALLLIRDRLGIVPLFYQHTHERLVFASEVKSILTTFDSAPSLNANALDQLMTFWSPVSPTSLFEGINEVTPGEMLVVKNGQITNRRYWDWSFPAVAGEYRAGNQEQLAEQLHDLLIDATRIRLRSDVPVGAYLSGGLDSSVLVSIIHNYSDAYLRTFSIGFEEAGLDEQSYQDALIQHLGADHSRIFCSNQDVADSFVDTIWHTEAPVLRTAPVPMRLLSGLVRQQGYKVVLTGEGADEVLGGYDIFKETKIRQFWAKNSDSNFRASLLKKLYPYLDISKRQGQVYLKNFFGMGLEQPNLAYFSHLPRWDTTAKCKGFFSDGLKGKLTEDAYDVIERSLPTALPHWHYFNRAQYIEAKSLMGGYLLCSQGDRMLMANSIEGRFPFLDHRVIEFANTLHPKFKMKALNEKFLLKKAMGKYLPQNIVKRYKQPYRAPDIAAFNQQGILPDYVEELLSESTVKDFGYFDPKRTNLLVQKIKKGRAVGHKDNMAFIGILSTQIWHRLFIEQFHQTFAAN